MMPERFDSRIDFMMEILKLFSPVTAMDKNSSFQYFMTKHFSALRVAGDSAAQRRNSLGNTGQV